MGEILQKVRQIIAEVVCTDPKRIGPDTDLALDLGVDSLDAIMVAAEVETEFGVKIEDAQVKRIRKVKDIVALLVGAPAPSGERTRQEAVGCPAVSAASV